uniref:Uncharacterized protein n=1 Tax=Anguilla anguilla TaxID=7936 RepID=A0A0E9P6N9_ANGAN
MKIFNVQLSLSLHVAHCFSPSFSCPSLFPSATPGALACPLFVIQVCYFV